MLRAVRLCLLIVLRLPLLSVLCASPFAALSSLCALGCGSEASTESRAELIGVLCVCSALRPPPSLCRAIHSPRPSSIRIQMSSRKSTRASFGTRRSLQPRPVTFDADDTAPTPAAAAASSSAAAAAAAPANAAAPAAASSSSSASSAAALAGFDPSVPSVRLAHLRSTVSAALDKALGGPELVDLLLASLPTDVVGPSPLQISRLGEKALSSARRNILQELEVILLEHGLPAKLAEVEFLASKGGIVLADGSVIEEAPQPIHALRSMRAQARRAEKARLEALVAAMDEENRQLKAEVTQHAARVAAAEANVQKAQQHTDAIYEAISNA